MRTEMVAGVGCHVFAPADADQRTDTRILHLHGGAFVSEPDNHHWRFVREVVLSTGATVIFPIYPLAPGAEHEKIRDCAMAVYEHFLADHRGHRFVFGDSAGGALAVYLTETLRERGDGMPTALGLLSPWLDMAMSDPRSEQIDPKDPELDIDGLRQAGRWYAGNDDLSAPEISPVHADYTGFPPMAVFTGTRDILNPDARRVRDAGARCHVHVDFHEYPGMFHNWTMQPIPEGRRARRQLHEFVRQMEDTTVS
ncbi:alpha/beta hydrolase fold domain-containing protein [Dietzia lutea]|uniref:alpha/beta hydrolase fold domain-containing protein n=1 Tax=Dietzia lutea TaxID=546160 RepID=UPI001330A9C2|nr:alpha/beta hydrolase [Dietzia lutea]